MRKRRAKPVRRRWTALLILAVACAASHAVASETPAADKLAWTELPALPPAPGQDEQAGLAGAFAGVHNDALLVAGGANFPDAPPWDGGRKVWWDDVFVLQMADDGGYRWVVDARFKLPRPLAYGVSISTDDGVVCIGGCDADRCYRDVFLLKWNPEARTVEIEEMPPLPRPLAFAAGAGVGDAVYVAGGQETMEEAAATTNVWSLDLSTKPDPEAFGWQARPAWPGPARILAVAAGQNDGTDDCFYLFSGRHIAPDRATEILTDAYEFNPRTGAWTRLAEVGPAGEPPRCIMGAPAAPSGANHVLVFGGADGRLFLELERLDRQIAAADGAERDALERRKRDILTGHPGFARDVLAYYTITDTWVEIGAFPTPCPVTATAVRWDGAFVIPSGEIRPGVRTAAVWEAAPPPAQGFARLDYAVLGVYLVVLVAMGAYFSRRMHSTDDFFRAGRRIPWWAAGLSIYATQLSAITFMAIPAKTFATDWRNFIGNMAIVVIAPFIVFWFLPFYRRLNVTTAYEYLERRFNLACRLLGSVSFLFLQFCRIGIVLLLPSLALSVATGIDVQVCIVVMGVLCIVYTVLGGMEAVVWTDVMQTFVLLGGALMCLILIPFQVPGGWNAMMDLADGANKLRVFDFHFSFTDATFFVLLFGALGQNVFTYGADQVVIQRYLTTRDERAAARSIWTNAILVIPGSMLFFIIGTALFAFYTAHPAAMNPTLEKTDAVFPFYIVTQLPAGLAGLLIAGVFAASMSSLDSSMNSMSTALTTDFYRRLRREPSERSCLLLARALTVVIGVLGTGISMWLAASGNASLWDKSAFFIGIFGSGLAGVFLLGIFTRRTHGVGAVVGFLVSMPLQIAFKTHFAIHDWFYGLTNLACCFVLGYAASLIIPSGRKPLEGLTIYTMRKNREGAASGGTEDQDRR